jgi:hypothetical protein
MAYKINRNTRCKICEERVGDIRKEYGDSAVEEGIFSEKLDGWVCGPCIEADETQGTVLVYKPQEGLVEKYKVMDHGDHVVQATVEDEEDLLEPDFDYYEEEFEVRSPIQFEWHHTDPWRGYYEAVGEGGCACTTTRYSREAGMRRSWRSSTRKSSSCSGA